MGHDASHRNELADGKGACVKRRHDRRVEGSEQLRGA